jgi:uncharacterized damage-inducible protein DinB
MAANEGLLVAHLRNWEMIDAALESLDDSSMARQPAEHCNSVAWILWHLSRVVDSFIHNRLRGLPQLWVQDGWHQKFGMEPDPEDRGAGWTIQRVSAWKVPAKEVQLGYYQAVKAAAQSYISSLSDSDLAVVKVVPPNPEPRSVAAALGQMTWDSVAHGGQIAYLRGLYLGMGWHR